MLHAAFEVALAEAQGTPWKEPAERAAPAGVGSGLPAVEQETQLASSALLQGATEAASAPPLQAEQQRSAPKAEPAPAEVQAAGFLSEESLAQALAVAQADEAAADVALAQANALALAKAQAARVATSIAAEATAAAAAASRADDRAVCARELHEAELDQTKLVRRCSELGALVQQKRRRLAELNQ
jgi:hypothetical protein